MPELPRPLPPPTWRDRVAAISSWRDGVPLPAVAVVVAAALLAAAVSLWVGASGGASPDVALSLPRAGAAESSPASGDTTTTVGEGPLHVHAAGAVQRPGVVEVPAGARVVDVVAAAGGPAADADLDLVNLAAPVSDGERVYIPRAGETPPPALGTSGSGAAANAQDAIVNLNAASESELETLPGVGPATAKAIVDYRSEHGRFRSVDDLLNVRGIGPAKLEQIRPHARV